MADISHHQFVALLKKSKVVEAKKLEPWLLKTKKITNARKLAKSLVLEKLLTTWQAKFLLSGRYRLRIGNYFLLSRLRRDELGARYLAVHASLKRKVELQIFSRDLTSDTKRWKDMIQKASLVAKLDHPALVHVYDIDHDDDRYFLVVEHVAGRALDVQKEIFTTPQIGKLVLKCVEGIEVAHQNKVVHGTIDQADILLTDKGTVKVQNLTVSPMRNQNSNVSEAEPIDDYVALALLGEKMLQGNPGADGGSGVGLATIFELMKSNGPGAAEKLRQWVGATPDAAAVGVEVTKSGANPIFSPTGESSSGLDLAKVDSSSIDPSDSDGQAAATSSASIIEAAWASRPFLIAVGIGIVMFFGIMSYGAYRIFIAKPAQAAIAAAEKDASAAKDRAAHNAKEQASFDARQAKNKRSDKDHARPQASNESKDDPKGDTIKKEKSKGMDGVNTAVSSESAQSKAEEPKRRSDAAEPTETSGGTPKIIKSGDKQPVEVEPADKPAQHLNLLGNSNAKTSTGADKKTTDAKKVDDEGGVPPVITDTDNLQKLTGIGPATEKALNAGGVKTYDQITKMKPADLDSVLVKQGSNRLGEKWNKIIVEAKPLAEVSLSKAANHFRKMPEEFDLPAIDSSAPMKLNSEPLLIPANYSMTTELISPDGISPKRIFFELNKSSDGRIWTVALKKTKTATKSTDVATFTKISDDLNFAWLPEAAKNKAAAYLRNCLLRLSTPDGKSSVSKLRKPSEIRPLRITEDNLSDSIKVEIEGAPDFDKIQIQLGKINNREVHVDDSSITLDSPAKVLLGDFGGYTAQFLTLQVAAERSKGSIKLTAGLLYEGRLIKSKDQLLTLQNQFAGVAANTKRRLQANPTDAMLKQAAKAEMAVKLMQQFMKSIEWLLDGNGLGEAINFEISASLDGGRVMLVKSNESLVDDGKKKKK